MRFRLINKKLNKKKSKIKVCDINNSFVLDFNRRMVINLIRTKYSNINHYIIYHYVQENIRIR